jgi:hypothetical protein
VDAGEAQQVRNDVDALVQGQRVADQGLRDLIQHDHDQHDANLQPSFPEHAAQRPATGASASTHRGHRPSVADSLLTSGT